MRLYKAGARWFTNEYSARVHARKIGKPVVEVVLDGTKASIVALLNSQARWSAPGTQPWHKTVSSRRS